MRVFSTLLGCTAALLLLLAPVAVCDITYQARHILDVGMNDDAFDIMIAPSGEIYAAGNSWVNNGSGSRERIHLTIYGPDLGTPEHTGYFPAGNPDNATRYIHSMGISSANKSVVVGSGVATGVSPQSAMTALFNESASNVWTDYYDAAGFHKVANDVAFGPDGYAYVVEAILDVHQQGATASGNLFKYDLSNGTRSLFCPLGGNNIGNTWDRTVPKCVIVRSDGVVFVGAEHHVSLNAGATWSVYPKLYKIWNFGVLTVQSTSDIVISDGDNMVLDLIEVPCTYGSCNNRVVMVTADGLVSVDPANLATVSTIARNYSKAVYTGSSQFAVIGPDGVGKFDTDNLSSPVFECDNGNTYVDVAATLEGAVICVGTSNDDLLITHFPVNATSCDDAESDVRDGGGGSPSLVDAAAAVACTTTSSGTYAYVFGTRFGSSHDYVTVKYLISGDGICPMTPPDTTYWAGDANDDNLRTVSDAVYVINYIFGGGPAPKPYRAGDADGSGLLTVSDAVYLISYIFSGGTAPYCWDSN